MWSSAEFLIIHTEVNNIKIGTVLYLGSLEETEKSFIKLRAFGFAPCQLCSWEPETVLNLLTAF